MRTILIISGTIFVAGASVLLVWRPAMALGLAILGGALSVWRMHRPHRHATVRPEIKIALPAPVATAPQPYTELLDRLRGAGWTVGAARSASPWIVAVNGAVKLAVRPAPNGPRATGGDIAEAMAAKVRDGAQYAAIVCAHRPTAEVTELAKESCIHIVNLARLEAYLALAASFKPGQKPAKTAAAAPHRIPA